MLCGYRSYGAIAEWGRNYGTEMLRALGFTHDTSPCAATLNPVLRGLDTEAVERVLATWAGGVGRGGERATHRLRSDCH